MRKRWVAPTPIENNDEQLLTALCPQRLDEYIGQQMVKVWQILLRQGRINAPSSML
jgi:Holliday junction resolvasome RuvABC ATP-dependent DNA helicase subunit